MQSESFLFKYTSVDDNLSKSQRKTRAELIYDAVRYEDESKVVELSDACDAVGRLLSCRLKRPCMFTVLSQMEDNLF